MKTKIMKFTLTATVSKDGNRAVAAVSGGGIYTLNLTASWEDGATRPGPSNIERFPAI